jgi:glycosyltransferase involved in cell wall biosynthesis
MVILFVSDFFNKKYNKLFFYYANETRVTYSFLDLNMLITLFQNINISEVIMNVLVSHWEPLKILSIVKNLKEQYGFKIIVPVHDFFLICPNFNLLDYKEKYCDIPSLDQCRQCLEKYDGENRQFIVSHDIKNWRGKWFDFLRTVDQITCFSNSSLDILKKAYPTIEQTCNVTIQPHIVDYIKPRTSLNIGVLGEIKLSKGSGIIWDILEIIKKDNLDVNITVIGTLSSKNINSNNLTVTGRYDKNEIAALVKRHDIDIFFVPSIWPETFSYTTEEIIKMNMPIAVFNLGAPAERVKRYHKGLIIENIDPRSALDALLKWRLLNPF